MAYRKIDRDAARAKGDLGEFLSDKRTAAFWAKVDARGPDECWPWLGTKTKGRYGTHDYGPLGTTAHRIAYMLKNGPLPNGLQALHSCDNPECMNPAHLFAGTQKDNLDDMRAKGRVPDYRNFGEHNGRTQFTDSEIEIIRFRHQTGAMTQTQLAAFFGVSVTTINRIVHEKSHKIPTPKTRAENPPAAQPNGGERS